MKDEELDKQALLHLLSGVAPGEGIAEHESDDEDTFLKNFLPVPDYRRVLEPDTLLVLGGRGTGKTELFRLLAHRAGRETLMESADSKALPPSHQTVWQAAFGRTKQHEKGFPTPESVEQTLRSADSLGWRAFWIGLMCGVMLRPGGALAESSLAASIQPTLRQCLQERLPLLSEWQPMVAGQLETLNHLLDRLDEELTSTNRWLFLTYDELDRLVPSYMGLSAPIRELLALWLDRWRRWERIRPKIFLRVDLFREDFLGFPDASKLKAHQIRLEWQTPWLYRLLVKRLANSGESMRTYLGHIKGLLKENHPLLGWMPTINDGLFEELIETMVGKFMGASPTKGATYRWIPNHLQDADGRIAPRSFLKLFALAAERRAARFRQETLAELLLLHPSDFQGALMVTSKDRIHELAQEEYPWLEALRSSFEDMEVPAQAQRFLEVLQKTRWSQQPDKQPPVVDPDEIVKFLAQLSIVQKRPDGRINVPEIYLYGFGMKRRGGVKRPK